MLNNLVRVLLNISYILIFSFIFIVINLKNLDYVTKTNVVKYNIVLIVLGIALFLAIYCITKNFSKYKLISKYKFLIFLSIVIFILQIIIVKSYYFKTGWDVGFAILPNAYELAFDNKIGDVDYFSTYPNNILIVILFSKIIKLCTILSLHNYSYFMLIITILFIANISGLVLLKTLELLKFDTCIQYVGYIYYTLLISISPWLSIPYTDSVGVIFPILLLFLYIQSKNSDNIKLKYIYLLFLSLLSVIAYNIKPHTVIIFIAICLFEIFLNNNTLKSKLKFLIFTSVVFILFFKSLNIMLESSVPVNKNMNIGILHYIKMGLNDEENGIYNGKDYFESVEHTTIEERNSYNIQVIKDRLYNNSFKNMSLHYIKKTAINYNDGTFGWGKDGKYEGGTYEDGTFYLEVNDNNTTLSKITRNIYYEKGNHYFIFNSFQQMNWLTILILSFISIFRNNGYSDDKYIILLSLIGIFLFVTIFEARARYLFTNVPIFIICAMYGLQNLIEIKNRKN